MVAKPITKCLRSALGSSEGPVFKTGGAEVDLRPFFPRRAAEDQVDPDDKLAGKWLDHAIQLFGGAVAFAEHVGVDLSYLTKMRSGAKPIAGRHIAKLRGEPEAVLGFVAELLESIGYIAVPVAGPSAENIRVDALAFLRGEPLLWRVYVETACRRLGWTPEQIELVLRGDTK